MGDLFVYRFQPLVATIAIFTYQPNLDRNKEPNQGKRSGSELQRQTEIDLRLSMLLADRPTF